MQRKKDVIQLLLLLSTVSTLLIVSIITFVSLGYFHSNTGFLVYGQNAIINNTVADTNGRIIYSNVTNSPKAFEATANPAIGALIEFSNPTSVSQENNTSVDFHNNLNNNDMMALTLKKSLPTAGSRVQVTGIYVIDVREGGHAELHPAYQIERIS